MIVEVVIVTMFVEIFKTVLYTRQFRPEFYSLEPYAFEIIIESISFSNLSLVLLIVLYFKKLFFSGRALQSKTAGGEFPDKNHLAGCTLLFKFPLN